MYWPSAYTQYSLTIPRIVQTALRDLDRLGPRDYWFPRDTVFGGRRLMLGAVLYPYVYLLARCGLLAAIRHTFWQAPCFEAAVHGPRS